MKLAIKLLLISLYSGKVLAAACCGGGIAAPALIVGDDRAQFSSSYTFSHITDDVDANGVWRKRATVESSETVRLEGAHIFKDRYQAGLSVPVIKRSMAEESSSGVGDVAATLGYEFLTDWDYSPWRPRGLGFLQLTLPTGRSINEAEDTFQLDARGRGFWAIGAGAMFTKAVGRWDLNSNIEAHRSFDKKYGNSQSSGTLKPGFGGSMALGGGISKGQWRAGASLTYTYEDPIDVSGTTASKGAPQRYGAAILSGSYFVSEDYTTILSYSDQSLLGSPVNTSLAQATSVTLQRRWPR